MPDEKENNVSKHLLIREGWARALLFYLLAFLTLFITESIGMLGLAPDGMTELILHTKDIVSYFGPWKIFVLKLFSFSGIILLTWWFRTKVDRKSFLSLGIGFSGRPFFAGMINGILLISAGFFILYASGLLNVLETNIPGINIMALALLFAIVAMQEELIFRGYILNNLMSSMDRYYALALSALLFAFMHIGNFNLSALAFINIFLAGILIGVYYIHRKNLWFPIGIHFTWNFFQGPVYGFEVSGVNTGSIITQQLRGNEWLTGGEFGLEGSIVTTVLIVAMIALLQRTYS